VIGQLARVGDAVARLRAAALAAHDLGLEVHAGHGLTLANVRAVLGVPQQVELNIGHSIVARAVLIGMAAAVREMKAAIA
jgi:pyridoxine 5-phosphate synthase